MILTLIAPLLFSSVFYTETLKDWPEETQQTHIEKETHSPKDHTILSSTRDSVHGFNCVSTVRVYRPDAPSVNASAYPVSTSTASVGAVGKMLYASGVWHVFYVLEVLEDALRIVDGNYDEGFVTVRMIPKYDARIVGYL